MNKNILLIFILVSFACSSCVIWDGGYIQSRIDIRFVDENYIPVENIELKVTRSEFGKQSYYWPVTNYSTDNKVLSDSAGIISLYHKRFRGIEFGGTTILKIISIPPDPKHVCRFYYNHKLIYKVPYSDLYSELIKTIDSTNSPDTIQCKFLWPNDSVSVEKFYSCRKTVVIKNKKLKK